MPLVHVQAPERGPSWLPLRRSLCPLHPPLASPPHPKSSDKVQCLESAKAKFAKAEFAKAKSVEATFAKANVAKDKCAKAQLPQAKCGESNMC